ncbi:MAG: 50S ribosomal protein L6 [Candidatus Omnitrophota bacterium]
MSKVGRQPVVVPVNVKVAVNGRTIVVEGLKGKLSFNIPASIEVKYDKEKISFAPLSRDKLTRSLFGTTRAIVNNMVKGVSLGFKKELEIIGVGYRAQMKGNNLSLQIGFSHLVEINTPKDIKVSVSKTNQITIEGVDKFAVGQFAANIRKIYPPEPYKGKGIRYLGEVVKKKLGKALAK